MTTPAQTSTPEAIYLIVNPIGTATKSSVEEAVKTIVTSYVLSRKRGEFAVYRYTLGTPGAGELTEQILTTLAEMPAYPHPPEKSGGRQAYARTTKEWAAGQRWREQATVLVTAVLTAQETS